jgi:hypothetical protein
MSDYNLVSTGRGRWLSPEALTVALAEAFPGTEFAHDLIPEAPVSLWAYVPDGDGHTGEVTLDDSGCRRRAEWSTGHAGGAAGGYRSCVGYRRVTTRAGRWLSSSSSREGAGGRSGPGPADRGSRPARAGVLATPLPRQAPLED